MLVLTPAVVTLQWFNQTKYWTNIRDEVIWNQQIPVHPISDQPKIPVYSLQKQRSCSSAAGSSQKNLRLPGALDLCGDEIFLMYWPHTGDVMQTISVAFLSSDLTPWCPLRVTDQSGAVSPQCPSNISCSSSCCWLMDCGTPHFDPIIHTIREKSETIPAGEHMSSDLERIWDLWHWDYFINLSLTALANFNISRLQCQPFSVNN